MFEYLGFLVLGVLIFTAFFLGILTGGIGLVVRPLLILWGVSPHVAIGSTRIASLGTRWAGLGELERHKKVNWKRGFLFFIPASIGGFFGAYVTGILGGEVLRIFMVITLVTAALFFARQKNLGTTSNTHEPTLLKKVLGFVLIVFASALGSITGGAGILVSYALIACYGETYITAAATRKVMGMGAGIAGSLYFLYHGLFEWKYVLLILVAGGLGSFFGVRYQVKKGEERLRKLTIAVTLAVGVLLLVLP